MNRFGLLKRDSAVNPASCRICNGQLTHKWTFRVLAEKYLAEYHECTACRSLQIPNPSWLDEAYRSESTPLACNPDGGRFIRNFSAYHYLTALHKAGLLSLEPCLLDFGGGYGLLTQMLYSGGYNAYQTDPYVPVPFLAPQRAIADFGQIPHATFDAITALEVLEHLTDPHETFSRFVSILKPTGVLILSTGIYESGVHDTNWNYLAREWGQHVTFWSKPALHYFAGRYGFRSVGYFPGGEGFLILFSRISPDSLKLMLAKAATYLSDHQQLAQAVSSWDLLAYQGIQISKVGMVEAAIPNGPDDLFRKEKAA
jgi:2-polyprenyl-3-methyl-5-hydroxy-6-metoxy-1,4-benzoquinol methylase